jgi:hypothetical protein
MAPLKVNERARTSGAIMYSYTTSRIKTLDGKLVCHLSIYCRLQLQLYLMPAAAAAAASNLKCKVSVK